jgi:fructokinase
MSRIYTLGESLLDVIHKDGRAIRSLPGGSVLNASITLGRLGFPVHLISEYGADRDGDIIDRFLKENNIDTTHVYRHQEGRTTRALAFLNENNEASYRFEKYPPPSRLRIPIPEFTAGDYLLFGSWYAIDPDVRTMVLKIVSAAHSENAFIIYDPNFRKAHHEALPGLLKTITENMNMAHMVRGSHEDFINIFNRETALDVYTQVKKYAPVLIYTASHKGVYVLHPSGQKYYQVPDIEPISTIGAGDNFNAGILFGLKHMNITTKDFTRPGEIDWDNLIRWAIACSTEVCLTTENYIPSAFAVKMRQKNHTDGFESK